MLSTYLLRYSAPYEIDFIEGGLKIDFYTTLKAIIKICLWITILPRHIFLHERYV